MSMPRYLITIVAVTILALTFPAMPQAQEAAGEVADTAETGAQSGEPDAAADETPEDADEEDADIDDADLDEQTYEQDDDVFIPTEEIPADEPIPFPSNI
jgi:hypothetical protein